MDALEFINQVAIRVEDATIEQCIETETPEAKVARKKANNLLEQAEIARTLRAALPDTEENTEKREAYRIEAEDAEKEAKRLHKKADDLTSKTPVRVGRLISVGDHSRLGKLIENRQLVMRTNNGKMEVIGKREILEQHLGVIKSLEVMPGDDTKMHFYLEGDTEAQSATIIECGSIDPKFNWLEACILVKVNAEVAGKFAELFSAVNGFQAEDEAKNA